MSLSTKKIGLERDFAAGVYPSEVTKEKVRRSIVYKTGSKIPT
jgi:hypothetical protein